MKTRKLRDIEVSAVVMKCMAFSHGYGKISSEEYSITSDTWLAQFYSYTTYRFRNNLRLPLFHPLPAKKAINIIKQKYCKAYDY